MSGQHTPGPWRAKNISGAGWGVWADLRPALGEGFSKNFPLSGSEALKTQQIQISYETWVQFPSEAFNTMQGANTVLMAAAPDLLAVMSKRVKDAEQRAFEDWLARTAPSGDVEQVQDQWERSFDCDEFRDEWKEELAVIAKATAPTTDAGVAG